MASHPQLDGTDWRILTELQHDGRLSFNQLARRVHLSAPAVAERVRRMEQSGVIQGYAARVDRERAGHEVLGFVELRCDHGRCLLRTTTDTDFPEVSEVHKLSGERCTMLKVHATSIEHLEHLVDRLGSHGELRMHLVLSTQYDDLTVMPLDPPESTHSPPSGWRRPGRH